MIVATAGHVDHGKTHLVQALTGVDTDTLAEEKKRGLSIDIGFAYLPLADAPSIGFIDVPGHERFMRNALCGLAAADFVLLVVAADDGPMPQTREHLAIIDLLGFRRGAIVISKIDRVEQGRVAEVMHQLDTLLRATTLAHWPRFALSAESKQGLQDLRACLCHAASCTAAPDMDTDTDAGDADNFRMPVDRCFEKKGAGLVVTGTVFAGCLRRDDSVTIAGSGMRLRVRELRVHEREQEYAIPGQRCAINLAGAQLRKDLIQRGSWVTSPRVAAPVERFDAEISIVNDVQKDLRHWTSVHLHLAAAESTARVAMLQGQSIAPGQRGLVQLVCDRPLGAAFGDHLIIRDQSARHTLGGGRVLDIFPPRRGRASAHRQNWLRQTANPDPAAALRALLQSSNDGVDLEQFALNRNLGSMARARDMSPEGMVELDLAGRRVGFSKDIADAQQAAVVAAMNRCYRALPDAVGFSRAQLRRQLQSKLAPALLQAWIEQLRQRAVIEADGAGYRLVGRRMTQDPETSRHWHTIETVLANNGLRPMTPTELAEATGLSVAQLTPLLERFVRWGYFIKLSANLLLLPEVLLELQTLVEQLQARSDDGEFSVADFRDASGIGRNRCIDILESFDARGITRRSGQGRRLLPAAQVLFAKLQPVAL